MEFYPELATKAGVLYSRLLRNHPLADGNKRVGYMALLDFVARNGVTWAPPPDDEEGGHTVAVIESLAASELSEDAFISWVHQHVA